MNLICGWCKADMGEIEGSTGGLPVSHGLCLQCLGSQFPVPVMRIDDIAPEDADRLPYGRIVLDERNQVIAYNRPESELSHRKPEAVLGLDFFERVAPCTNVRDLAGWVADRREAAEAGRTELDFIFDFPFGKAFVHMALVYEPQTGQTTILVARVAEEASEEPRAAAAT